VDPRGDGRERLGPWSEAHVPHSFGHSLLGRPCHIRAQVEDLVAGRSPPRAACGSGSDSAFTSALAPAAGGVLLAVGRDVGRATSRPEVDFRHRPMFHAAIRRANANAANDPPKRQRRLQGRGGAGSARRGRAGSRSIGGRVRRSCPGFIARLPGIEDAFLNPCGASTSYSWSPKNLTGLNSLRAKARLRVSLELTPPVLGDENP